MKIAYTCDTNALGNEKIKWWKYFISKILPNAKFYVAYSVEELIANGDPDVIICEDLTRANPGRSEKIYNRSRIYEYGTTHGIQTHVIAQDVIMQYHDNLENASKSYVNKPESYEMLHTWYGVEDFDKLPLVRKWLPLQKKFPGYHAHLNLGTAVSYIYMRDHEEEMKKEVPQPEESCYGYYGFWRQGSVQEEVMAQPIDIVIGSFKWRPLCEEKGITWWNGNKSHKELFSKITKSFIPYDFPKSDVQHTSRQFESIIYCKEPVVYSDQYPEDMKVYSMQDPRLREVYYPIIQEFLDVVRNAR